MPGYAKAFKIEKANPPRPLKQSRGADVNPERGRVTLPVWQPALGDV
jgi:hypothetical protein